MESTHTQGKWLANQFNTSTTRTSTYGLTTIRLTENSLLNLRSVLIFEFKYEGI